MKYFLVYKINTVKFSKLKQSLSTDIKIKWRYKSQYYDQNSKGQKGLEEKKYHDQWQL